MAKEGRSREAGGGATAREEIRKRFFPDSLCHDCAAPPRFVRNDRGSTFLFCPLWKKYPPQPVRSCDRFVPVAGSAASPPGRTP